MNHFLLRNLLFSLFVIALLVAIIAGPYNRKFGYTYLGGDYIKSAWNYQRIFQDTTRIDVAFIGTSRTLNGIVDSLVALRLESICPVEVEAVNLGLKDIGSNLHYVVARDLFEHKKPRLLVMEVREIESNHGHKYFAYLAQAKDILSAPWIINVNLVSDLKNAVYSRAEFINRAAGLSFGAPEPLVHHSDYGFEENFETVDSAKFDRIIKERNSRIVYRLPEILQNIGFRYSKTYLKKIADLASANNCQIVFLYLPYHGAPVEKPMVWDFYRQYGPVWLTDEVFDDRELFVNPTHLGYQGATRLTQLVADSLARQLCPTTQALNIHNVRLPEIPYIHEVH